MTYKIDSFPDLIPLRAVWLSGMFQVLGAGGATLSSMVFAQLADVCPAEQRTAAFSILAGAALLNQLVFVPVGAALMSFDPWVPMWLTSVLGVLGFIVGWLFVPETRSRKNLDEGGEEEEEEEEEWEEEGGTLGGKNGMWAQIRGLGGTGREVIAALAQNKSATLVLFASLCFSLAIMSDSSLLLQYASKRLGWTIGEVRLTGYFFRRFILLIKCLFRPQSSYPSEQVLGCWCWRSSSPFFQVSFLSV